MQVRRGPYSGRGSEGGQKRKKGVVHLVEGNSCNGPDSVIDQRHGREEKQERCKRVDELHKQAC